MKTNTILIALLVVVAFMMTVSVCEAASILGGSFIVTNSSSDIIVTALGSFAAYTHYLYFDNTNTFLFSSAATGTSINLGTFAAGTELIFRLDVQDTGYSYYTGPASRNPDNEAHAIMTDTLPNTYEFGFEDIYGGGDLDFNDCLFKLEGAIRIDHCPPAVPEPASLALLLLGVVPFLRLKRRA